MPEMNAGAAEVTLRVTDRRGPSAYEIAVSNGFEGTETEWLESLRGADGSDAAAVTVNGKSAAGGNITLRGTDIQLQAGLAKTVAEAIAEKADQIVIVNNLTTRSSSQALSAAQGAALADRLDELNAEAAGKAETGLYTAELSADGWSAAAPYTQTVSVTGLRGTDFPVVDFDRSEADASTIGALREAYACIDRVAAGENSLTAYAFTEKPETDLILRMMVVR